jgi:lipoprotein-anchoring transpeptidase ErfK/SrfK
MRASILAAACAALFAFAAPPALAISADEINEATFDDRGSGESPSAFVAKAQALLGRRSISPGVIDGLDGDNYRKAVAQFRRMENLGDGDEMDEETWRALGGEEATDIVVEYKITQKDANYDFADEIPSDYAKLAKMKRLSYTSPREMLAERFHMGEGLLEALNPKAAFGKAGETIAVVSVEREKPEEKVVRVVADKGTGMVIAYGAEERILGAYPATIGSEQTPSPDGEHKVTRIAIDPTYHYDPDKNFQQGDNTKPLVLPPGPNNPVGKVWIALSKPTYGIHGTAEPAQVSKNASHGCVRLTNWDAEELARMVRPGVVVEFID